MGGISTAPTPMPLRGFEGRDREDRPGGGRLAVVRSDTLEGETYRRRALAFWPRLDRARLTRAHGDPLRIARIIERRTALPLEAILGVLMGTRAGLTVPGRPGIRRGLG